MSTFITRIFTKLLLAPEINVTPLQMSAGCSIKGSQVIFNKVNFFALTLQRSKQFAALAQVLFFSIRSSR